MEKIYNLKIMMAALLVLLLSVGNVFADKGWVQVTYNSNLSVGDTVIIAAAEFDKAMGTQNNNNRAAVDIVKSADGGRITSIGYAQMFIVQAGNAPGTIAFFDPNCGTNGGYLYAAGGATSGNYLRTDTLDNNGRGNWLISFSDDGAIESIVAQTTATNRVYMRFNENGTDYSPLGLFSCYGESSTVTNLVTIYRYEEVEAATVAAPEITPVGGSYNEPQTVSISCVTPGATIFYTLDGSNPATNGIEYTTPFIISASTTVKAVAILGTETSDVSQVTYTFTIMENIAAFKALHSDNTSTSFDDNTEYFLNEDVTFVFKSGAYMYVKDANDGLLVYGTSIITNEYTEGDVIPGGLNGKYKRYNNQVEMIPTQNPASSTENTGAVQPMVITMAELLANYNVYDAQLITLENVTFPNGFTGSNNTTITQGESQMTLRKQFSDITLDTTLAAGTVTNVTGLVGRYNNTVQLYPRGNFDLSSVPQPAQPSLTVTLNSEQFSTLDTLEVDFEIQNFTLGTDGWLKLESEMFTTIGMQSPILYLNDQMLDAFLAQTFSPLPAGTHTVTASLVDMTMQPLTPAVSQTVTFTVIAPVAAIPVISPAAGMYTDSVEVTMTCATPGAQIRYTIYGDEPSATSTLYEGPFTLNSSRTVKAKAFMNNVSWEDSPVASAAYTIVSGPTLTVDPTSLAFGPNNLTSTVNIYSASLTEPITISCNNNDFQLSATSFPANVGNTSFTITYTGFGPAFGTVTVSSGTLSAQIDMVATAQLPAPVITPASGTTDTVITVVMSDDVQGAGISYTLDGTDPDVYSPVYQQPIILNVPGEYVVKAYAFYEGWGASEITTATYTVVAPVVPDIDTVIYTTGFEAEEGFVVNMNNVGAVYNNNYIYYSGTEGQQWGTYYGTPSGDANISGEQSMQMRWYTSNPDRLGYTFTNFDLRNVTYVTFDAKQTSGNKLKVSYSIDGGNSYVGDSLYALTTNRHNYRFNVSETGEYNFVRLRFDFVLTDGTPVNKSKVVIDSVVVFGVPGIVVEQVETPVLSHTTNTYYDAFDATITCATADAVIRYTLDGTEPTETSAVYSAPININSTTTLKAKAWKEGMEPSFVAAATYSFPPVVDNIADFKAANTETNNTVYKISGDVTFVFRSGRYMIVEDASAALMIYDNNNPVITTTYNEGDVISGGVFGSYSLYHGMAEMVPARNTAEASSNTGTVTPLVATIPTLVSQYSTYECRLVTVQNVTFLDNGKFVNGTDTMVYFDNFNSITNAPEQGDMGNVTGFVAIRDGQVRLYPRDDNDFTIQTMEQVATPEFTPASGLYPVDSYSDNFEVSISCATEGATIYYTLDGTDPDENSLQYTNPIACNLYVDNTIKAIAMKAGMVNSEIAMGFYQFMVVGIHDIEQQVSIYPNPTTGDVTLDLFGLNARTVELFSMSGQLLNSVIPTENVMTLSLNQYAAGVYFVRIHSDNAVTTQKIVKK
jgi:DNA/RNA endonuclease YhcR with UshA esterase domain